MRLRIHSCMLHTVIKLTVWKGISCPTFMFLKFWFPLVWKAMGGHASISPRYSTEIWLRPLLLEALSIQIDDLTNKTKFKWI